MSAAVSILSIYASDSEEEEQEQQTSAKLEEETAKPKVDHNDKEQSMQIDDETQKVPIEKRKLVLPDPDILLSKKSKPNKMNSLIPPQLITKSKNIVTESS